MFRNILVPLDGSKIAEKALEFATQMAVKGESKIHLVQVCLAGLIFGTLSPMGDYHIPESLLEDELKKSSDYLAKQQEQLEVQGHLTHQHAFLGEPAEGILEVAEREKCDLVVMTSHGRSGMTRFLIGSVAERICRHAACPVLIINRHALKADA